MMNVSQKSQYALRAVYELARRFGTGPTPISEIAERQAIPPKFLEAILRELRGTGIVDSRRGPQGGYLLTVSPARLTVGRLMRITEGSFTPVDCIAGGSEDACPLHGGCPFLGLWQQARDAVAEVFDNTTFEDLIASERSHEYVGNYCI